MIDPSIKEREKANENFNRLIRFASFLRLVGGGSSDNAFLTIDFSSGRNIEIVNSSGGAAGLAQKLDNTFQSFPSGVLRKTDRGLIIEEARTNWVKASADFPNALWPKGATFASSTPRVSIIPGQTAIEYESDTTAYLVNQIGITGNYGSAKETVGFWVEALPSSNIIRFACSVNGASVEFDAQFNLQTFVYSVSGIATNIRYGYIDFGAASGPNGGRLLLLIVSFTPNQVGLQRKFFIYPNNNVSLAAGRKVILHHFEEGPGSWSVAPIVNSGSSATSRAADVVTISVPTGTYHIRYTNSGIAIADSLSVASVANVLTLPATAVEHSLTTNVDLRNASIQQIGLWASAFLSIHCIGDSFVDASLWSSGTTLLMGDLPFKLNRPRIWTFDGVGGTSLTQQATRFDSTPQFYGDVLIIIDGAINSNTFSIAQAAIDSMVAHLTTNPKKWLYIQPDPDATAGNEAGGATYIAWAACMASIKAAYPNNYVDTLAIMQSQGDGSANDNSDIANGWWPRSLRMDNVHPNASGASFLAQIIANAIQLNRF